MLNVALGTNKVDEHDWPAWTARVLDVVWDSHRRASTRDYVAIRDYLSNVCGIPCIEVDGAVGSADPLLDTDVEHGRCSLRLLDFFGRTEVHLVIRRQPNEHRMTWSLLHELGHLVCHNNHLLHTSTLYHRVSLDPYLEDRVGSFVSTAKSLRDAMELEADLFAATWLLPTWMDSNEFGAGLLGLPGLTADGYRFYALRAVLSDKAIPRIEAVDVDELNALGAAQRRRAGRARPSDSYWERIAWAVFNRQAQRGVSSEVVKGLQAYARVLSAPNPRAIPELRLSSAPTARPVVSRWIRRWSRDDAEEAVDRVQWSPFVVGDFEAPTPAFYIPIRPVPSPVALDSSLGWQHMMKSTLSPPQPLGRWLDQADAAGSNLLVFPRTPAERELDLKGLLRP